MATAAPVFQPVLGCIHICIGASVTDSVIFKGKNSVACKCYSSHENHGQHNGSYHGVERLK